MSSYNKQIVNNSIFSVIQIVIVSLCAFYLYKYIIEAIGLEKLGLWSLILSVTSLANIGNFGFTGSLVKFSAELSIKKEYEKINAILNTSIVSVSFMLLLLLSVVYLLGYHFIIYFIDEKWISNSRSLLFYALISLYVNILAGLYFSVLEGLNLAYLRSISFISATIIYMILAIIFINKFDLIGLGYAQVLQAVVFLILGILLSKKHIQNFKFLYFKWHKELMKKVFNYGLNFQVIGLSQMLYDPITKAVLSRYGSLDYVAIFEMASKLVVQVRAIAAGIIQNFVPKIITLNFTDGIEKMVETYKKINNFNLILLFSSLVLIIPFSNIISIYLFGESESSFIFVLIVICVGWLLNSFNIPSYMINLGTGDLKWNVIPSLIIGISNLIFCGLVGMIFKNGLYIILTWIFALVFGSWIIILEYHIRNKISFFVIFNKVFFQLLFYFILLILVSYFINTAATDNITLLVALQVTAVFTYYIIILLTINQIKDILNQVLFKKG